MTPSVGSLFRRSILRQLAALGAGAASCGCYAVLIEPFWVRWRRVEMPLKGLPSHLEGRMLVQISDLHASARVSTPFLQRHLQAVAALKPDYVVYTGDYISLDSGTDAALRAVAQSMPLGRLGTAAVLGNHDYGVNWGQPHWAEKIVGLLQQRGVRVLRNEGADFNGLQILGMDDLWSGRLKVKPTLDLRMSHKPSLVLCHNPDALDLPGWDDFTGWVLCGHTHGGQCRPPFLPAPLLPVKNKRYERGLIELGDGRQAYINPGLGWLHQVRFAVRPEITLFKLSRAA